MIYFQRSNGAVNRVEHSLQRQIHLLTCMYCLFSLLLFLIKLRLLSLFFFTKLFVPFIPIHGFFKSNGFRCVIVLFFIFLNLCTYLFSPFKLFFEPVKVYRWKIGKINIAIWSLLILITFFILFIDYQIRLIQFCYLFWVVQFSYVFWVLFEYFTEIWQYLDTLQHF